MKNILVPTDFSNNAYNALHYATRLFKNEPCKFYLLHSFEKQVSLSTSRIDIGKSEQITNRLFDESYERLNMLLYSITIDSEGLGHQFETVSSSKALMKEINFLIKGMTIDYVVMGTKGQTGAKEVLFGSTTLMVIKKIKDCPLLVIPVEINFEPIKTLAFITGFRRAYTDFEIRSIHTLAALTGSVVHIAHILEEGKINQEQRENLFQLKEKLKSLANDVYWISKGTTKTESILDFVFNNNINMLAMIYYKHGFLNSLFRESTIKKIGLHPGIPFLMIPASN